MATAEPQVPPLRYAPVGMTRGEGWLRLEWPTECVLSRVREVDTATKDGDI